MNIQEGRLNIFLKLNKKQRNYKTLITKTLPQNIINYHQSTDKKG